MSPEGDETKVNVLLSSRDFLFKTTLSFDRRFQERRLRTSEGSPTRVFVLVEDAPSQRAMDPRHTGPHSVWVPWVQ